MSRSAQGIGLKAARRKWTKKHYTLIFSAHRPEYRYHYYSCYYYSYSYYYCDYYSYSANCYFVYWVFLSSSPSIVRERSNLMPETVALFCFVPRSSHPIRPGGVSRNGTGRGAGCCRFGLCFKCSRCGHMRVDWQCYRILHFQTSQMPVAFLMRAESLSFLLTTGSWCY